MSENYEQPSELKSVPSETVPTNTPDQPEYRPLGPDEVIQAGDEFRTSIGWSHFGNACYGTPLSYFQGKWEARRPIAAEKREEAGVVKTPHLAEHELIELRAKVATLLQERDDWMERAHYVNDQNSTLQQQLAEAHKDTRTCGELSCDECNERYQKAIVEISTLQQQLAQFEDSATCYHQLSNHIEKLFRTEYPTAHSTPELVDWARVEIDQLRKQLAQEKEARETAEEVCHTLVRNVEQPSLVGSSTLVLYFPADCDREEFIAAFKEAKPNCKTIKL